jgi:VanZ family protein
MFSSRWFRNFFWLAVVAWAATIFYLSTKTGHEIERMNFLRLWDKAAHFAAFAAGGCVLAFALRFSSRWSWKGVVCITALLISAYGWSDEWHQQYTPGRSAKDVRDWTADTLGGLCGALVASWIYARYLRAPRLPPAGT